VKRIDRIFKYNFVKNLKTAITTTLILMGVIHHTSQAQAPKIIQLSGLIVGGDSLYGIPGVYIYVPKAGRGTTSDHFGYFSLPVLIGDTVLIKALGYRPKNYIVPEIEEKLSVVIEMTEDTTFLPLVEVFPWPTEKIFKEAFLALELPNRERSNAEKNLSSKTITRMLYNLPDDGSMNHRYFLMLQGQAQSKSHLFPTLSLIDPFAWSRFIKSTKKGGLKHREEKDYYEEDDDK
jgi:hypothetical protein